jgi:hypothetical protein
LAVRRFGVRLAGEGTVVPVVYAGTEVEVLLKDPSMAYRINE